MANKIPKFCGKPLRNAGEWWYWYTTKMEPWVAGWVPSGDLECGSNVATVCYRVCRTCMQRFGYLW